jgi:WD40 repeat protein
MAVTFTLLVHTYCELLESGLEGTACALLATYRPMHEPLYRSELEDLQKCRTTADIVALNANVTANTESLLQIKNVRTQIAVARKKRVDLTSCSSSGASSDQMRAVKEVDDQLASLDGAYRQALLRVTACANQLKNLPFLRRARALRWQIGLSATSYSLLASFLNQPDLQPMSSLLQARCHVNVEKRDPLPYTPHSILEDMVLPSSSGQETDEQKDKDNGVKWAAPMHPVARLVQEGEDVTKVSEAHAILSGREALPFPEVYLDTEGYDTSEKALKAKQSVEFNRALLMNGFRRLEALELKAEYEVGMRQAKSKKKKAGDAEDETHEPPPQDQMADPLAPSVLMSTLCSSSFSGSGNSHKALVSSKSGGRYGGAGPALSHLEAPGIGITCARMCPPDGRRVATGCDDAAIRIWSLHNNSNKSEGVNTGSSKGGKGTVDSSSSATVSTANMDEASMILLGHKNGFPVFDLDWNRDGRTLISAGGDGTVRLWDTLAVGPYGRLAKVVKRSSGTSSSHVTSINKAGLNPSGGPNTSVSGMKTEPMVEINGAALAVYRGHSPQTPLWSVSFAPSGYYFLTGGSDSTARLWTTDRTTPVRIFSGHQSPNVNSVTWHPNCNYVVTGSDDKTARLWDIQSGRCVRLLSGCAAGINVVTVCPSGRYVAGADYSGTVNIWELGTGRKVNELRPPITSNKAANIIHSVAYSSCGTALATGGEDCLVNIWDVRGVANHMSDPDYAAAKGWGAYAPPMTMVTSSSNQPNNGEQNRFGMREPIRSFRTKHTSILDLFYTKRNLLLSVGNYTVVPAGGVSESNPAQ